METLTTMQEDHIDTFNRRVGNLSEEIDELARMFEQIKRSLHIEDNEEL